MVALLFIGLLVGSTVGAVAQPAPNGTNTTTTNATTTNATTGLASNTNPTTTGQRTPDITVRSAAGLVQAAQNAPAGANVFVPPDATITVEPGQVVFDQPVTLYSAGGKFGQGGGTIQFAEGGSGATVTLNGQDSTIAGLRLIGPYPDTIHGETGPDLPNSFGVLVQAPGTRVYNSEIIGYTHAGVQFRDVQSGRVYLSSIHHNTDPGLGYGVSVAGSNVSIQNNRFDANRHSIQTTRDTESSYRAQGNIQGPRRPNHAFDVHSSSRTEAANGGRRIEIVGNTFLPPSSETDAAGDPMNDPAIELDGRNGPTEGGLIARNAFVGIERGRAVIQNQENGGSSEEFANDQNPSEFNNIRLQNNAWPPSRSATPQNVGAPDSMPAPGQVAAGGAGPSPGSGAGTGVGTGAGAGTSGGLGVPSPQQIAGDLVDATVGAAANAFTDAAGGVFMFPWKFVTMRFAPFEDGSAGGGDGPLAIRERPDAPLFGQLYDIATGSLFYIALLLFGAFLVIDWFGNLSAAPGADGPVERLFLRAADCLHLLFSWPIAWGHFLLASYLAYVFLPGQEAVTSTVNEGLSNIIGLAGAAIALIYVPFLLVIFLWLLVKHAGAFVYLVIGLAAYPALVAAGIPDHWLLGRLGAFAENTRQKFVVAAWYPVPTAVVLGIGYQIDGALLELMIAGNLLNDAPAGAIVYPILWLTALYAPDKVFSDGSPPLRNWKSKFSRGSGGPPGGGGGGGGGGPPPGSGASAPIGGAAARALAAGAGAGSAAGSTASSGGSLARSGSGAFSRLKNASPSQRTLAADGGLQTMSAVQTDTGGAGADSTPGGAKAIGGGFGPSPGASSTTGAKANSAGTNGTYSTGTASSEAWEASSLNDTQGVTPVTDQTFDVTQRYEPYTYHEKGGFQRLDPPKNTEWLTEKGGIDRLNDATDEPLRFKGENDGQMYDLRNVTRSDTSYNSVGNSGADTIRET